MKKESKVKKKGFLSAIVAGHDIAAPHRYATVYTRISTLRTMRV